MYSSARETYEESARLAADMRERLSDHFLTPQPYPPCTRLVGQAIDAAADVERFLNAALHQIDRDEERRS